MRIALVSGTMSTAMHGRIDVARLFDGRALTGSESSFFNIARGLRHLGHDVDVYCDCVEPFFGGAPRLGGTQVFLHDDERLATERYDAVVSSSEPDLLRPIRHGLRIVQQQLNDFDYCKKGFDEHVDAYVFASRVHAERIGSDPRIDASKVSRIPNSIDLDMVGEAIVGDRERRPHAAVWCSSPDRGLHRLLEMWPEIRARISDATLEIFYRFDPWYEGCKGFDNWAGRRARFIAECLRRLGRDGENGIIVRGPVANRTMIRILSSSRVLPYTCEPVRFTEGFGVSVLDACAAGCVPIVSDVDALGSIYDGAAHVIPDPPEDRRQEWIDAIVRSMTDDEWALSIARRAREFAQRFDYRIVAKDWEEMILLGIRNRVPMEEWPMEVKRTVAVGIGREEAEEEIARRRSESIAIGGETSKPEIDLPDPDAHRALTIEEVLGRVQAQGLTEKRYGVFGSRGRYYGYHFLCSPRLDCHPSWWSLSDETVVRDLWWHVDPGDVVVDAGAAYGSYTLTALAMGASRVIAWTPEEHEALVANLRLNGWQGRGSVFGDGLWSRSGWLAIWPGAPKPAFFERKPEGMPEGATALFPVVSMDDAFETMAARLASWRDLKVGWIKMDVEGCEVEVLRGARRLVARCRPKILVENHLFKDAGIKVAFGALLKEIEPTYREAGTMPYATVSHTLWSI